VHNLNNVLEYIKTLSISDQKSLVGKTLKAAEELGELSKEVLPYEHSFATTHRFPSKDKILEESCDLLLCALSIPFSLGFTTDDIATMMKIKADKWAGLQQASAQGKFPLPFEIHITVDTDDQTKFINCCKLLDVKPIVLDLQNDELPTDVMTSSVIITDNLGAYTEMKRISDSLVNFGFTVVREKIETVPYHPAAPSEEYGTAGSGGYFESHLNIIIKSDEDRSNVANVAMINKGHLSRNKFKINLDSYNQMMTIRSYDKTREEFNGMINFARLNLHHVGVEVERVIVEYAIFDSKVSHDLSWLTKTETEL
jgi:hypothetical protein